MSAPKESAEEQTKATEQQNQTVRSKDCWITCLKQRLIAILEVVNKENEKNENPQASWYTTGYRKKNWKKKWKKLHKKTMEVFYKKFMG